MSRRVAIVGQSFRFPGTDPARYWTDLLAGRNLVGVLNSDRFPADSFIHPDPRHPGTSYSFAAGVIDHVGDFDAGFFGISPREAAQIDPQQRLLLELAWEALENAGIPPSSLRGSGAGVFVGLSNTDYSYRLVDDMAAIDAPSATGNAGSIAANRLSWFFDLHGPSMAVDTACSSSLVAFHLACQSVQRGESSLALVGGVNLLLHPYVFVSFAKASMLSRQGRCRVFDASADGYVRAEGGGVLVLKDLEQARADGDPVLAIVAGSGVNTDGYTQRLTQPNAAAQAALLERVYAEAGIAPDELDYLEAHGTGTAVGDPIETRAISAALATRRERTRPLPIGSVKSNMGHLEPASGIAGLIKAVHCLVHRVVPATIGVERINPNIPVADWNLEIVTDNRPLPGSGRLVVGVNSFGFGGANAHVVLTSAEGPPAAPAAVSMSSLPMVVSARDGHALRARATQIAGMLRNCAVARFNDIAWQLNYRSEWMTQRLLVQGNAAQVARALREFGAGEDVNGELLAASALPGDAGVLFVYAGNGAQWAGMGRRLLATSPTFRAAVGEVDALLRAHGGCAVLDELLGLHGEERYAATEIAQPALFALQVAATAMLRQQGVKPSAVVGHSVGEIAAAWAAGALSLEAAVKVIHERSRLQGTTRGTGGMTAVGLSAEAAGALIASLGHDAQLCVAAANAAADCTLSGAVAALAAVESKLAELGIFHRRLQIDYAFHSPLMDDIEPALASALAKLAPSASTIPFYSTVTGGQLDGSALGADYWWRNIRDPVAFEPAVAAAIAAGNAVCVEIGPHPVLSGYLRQIVQAHVETGLVVPSLSRQDDSEGALWRAGAQAILASGAADWRGLFPHRRPPIRLPTYPWQRQHLWHATTPESLGVLGRALVHPLLGHAVPRFNDIWEHTLDPAREASLADHVVGTAPVLAAAGYAELALAVARHLQHAEWLRVNELEIRAPLVLGNGARLVRTTFEAGEARLRVRSRPELAAERWVEHLGAELPGEGSPPRDAMAPFSPPDAAPAFDGAAHYACTARHQLHYGPAFRRVLRGWATPEGMVAQLSAAEEDDRYVLAPPVLDAALQLIVHLAPPADDDRGQPKSFLPVRIGRLSCRRAAGPVAFVRARVIDCAARVLRAGFELFNVAGEVVAVAEEVMFRQRPEEHASAPRRLYWRWDALPAKPPQAVAFARYADYRARVDALAGAVRERAPRAAYLTEVEPLLDRLCGMYLQQALLLLADADGLLGAGHAADGQAWRARLLADAVQEGLAAPQPAGWQIAPAATSLKESIAAVEHFLLSTHPAWFEPLRLVARTGRALPALWRGEVSFADLHPPGLGAAAVLARVRGVDLTAQIRAALDPLSGASARPVRVMEIAVHAPLWPDLLGVSMDDRGRFRFASPSTQALRKAGARWPWLATLSVPDGPPPETHDCELVLLQLEGQSSTDLAAQLALARGSLAPGGVLLVLGQAEARWVDWVFAPAGLGLEQRGLLHWTQTLQGAGWQDCHGSTLEGEQTAGCWMLVARAPALPEQVRALSPDRARVLLLADAANAGLAAALREVLTNAGAAVEALPASDPATLAARLACHADLTDTVLLAGSHLPEAGDDAVSTVRASAARCALAAALAHASEAVGTNPNCWLLTRNAFGACGTAVGDAALWGYGRSLMNEVERVRVRLLELGALDDAQAAHAIAAELLAPGEETELRLTGDGGREALRISAFEPPAPPASKPGVTALTIQQPGALEHLRWRRQAPLVPDDDEVEVAVAASALNFRDLMLASGLLPPEAAESGLAGLHPGLEFAGTVCRVGRDVQGVQPGDRVMGYGPSCFAERVVTKHWALAAIPPGLGFAAAATIPAAFVTAWYSLVHLAQVRAGERVLVHAAAGGVGLASIQIAHSLGAEIYATAGAEDKRDFLRLYGVRHLYDSRSLAFADEILRDTDGCGVDVVLNSLAGEAMVASTRVLKPFGRFIELGKRDFFENTRLGLRPFRHNLAYFGVDVDQLMRVQPALARRLLDEVASHFAEGALAPLPYREFAAPEILDAFRAMQSARHVGKLVVSYPTGVPEPAQATPAGLPLRPDATYLVTGGLGGMGLEIARWLAAQGACHLALIGRRGALDEEARAGFAPWTAGRLQLHIEACDVTDRSALMRLFEAAERAGRPIRGVIHAAAHYRDGLARLQEVADIEAVLRPKLLGALNLHALTIEREIDFLVLMSSATTVFGNPGQSAYVAANHALEALARARRSRGLPASAVLPGPIDDAGYLARHETVKHALLSRLGGRALRTTEALQALAACVAEPAREFAALHFDWPTLRGFLRSAASPRFGELSALNDDASTAPLAAGDVRERLLELDEPALRATVQASLLAALAAVLGIEASAADVHAPVYSLGLDSLMGVELAVSIETRFGLRLPEMGLGEQSVTQLTRRIVDELRRAATSDPETTDDAREEVPVLELLRKHEAQAAVPRALGN